MNAERKILSLLSLARKAGKVKSGEFSTEQSVRGGRAQLVIIAADASGNTRKKFSNMCTYYKVPIFFFGEKEALGHAIGCGQRSSLAVEDAGLGSAVAAAFGSLTDDRAEE